VLETTAITTFQGTRVALREGPCAAASRWGRLPGTELNGLILNCTLKKSPEPSNTQGLIDIVTGHFGELGVKHETLRPVDYTIPFGVVSDMGEGDEWPQILEKVLAADILIIAMSIWFGVRNSSARW
jgi:hypothetical protein